jgi:hypothetical protein
MPDGILERAARMVKRSGFRFGAAGKTEDSSPSELPTPETHYMRPVRHANPMTGEVQTADPVYREL